MKPYLLILMLGLTFSCTTQQSLNKDQTIDKMTFEPNDEGKYDIVVFDPDYTTFLASRAEPKSFHSLEYYKQKNRQYAMIWNQRHSMPMQYNPDLYAVNIDLDPNIEYGLDFEYKLYNFFRFIETKYRVRIR